MFNPFKRKRVLGEYIKYSRSTARINKQMIINEYQRLIDKINNEIKETKEYLENVVITFSLPEEEFNELIKNKNIQYIHDNRYSDNYNKKYCYYNIKFITSRKEKNLKEFFCDFTRKDIYEIYKTFVEKEEKLKVLEKEKNLIFTEYQEFLNKFNK